MYLNAAVNQTAVHQCIVYGKVKLSEQNVTMAFMSKQDFLLISPKYVRSRDGDRASTKQMNAISVFVTHNPNPNLNPMTMMRFQYSYRFSCLALKKNQIQ